MKEAINQSLFLTFSVKQPCETCFLVSVIFIFIFFNISVPKPRDAQPIVGLFFWAAAPRCTFRALLPSESGKKKLLIFAITRMQILSDVTKSTSRVFLTREIAARTLSQVLDPSKLAEITCSWCKIQMWPIRIRQPLVLSHNRFIFKGRSFLMSELDFPIFRFLSERLYIDRKPFHSDFFPFPNEMVIRHEVFALKKTKKRRKL